MRAIIRPGTARGTVAAPPSKSMAHRLLICAGLADGESLVEGVDPSEDILATIDCLEAQFMFVAAIPGERLLLSFAAANPAAPCVL